MNSPIVVLDLGSLDGFSPIWDQLEDNVELIGVDPFEHEGTRKGKYGRKEVVFKNIIGDRDQENVDFYVSIHKQASSLFKENTKFVSRFHAASGGQIVSTEKVSVKEISKLLKSQNIHSFDFLKIDVEGSELSIMKNLESILKENCLGILSECFFQNYRVDTPLFSEIELYLRKLGYYVFDISLEKWGRLTNQIAYPVDHHGNIRGGNGQVMFANVLFLKDPILDENSMTNQQIEKLITLANLYNQIDFADELKEYFNL